MAVAVDEALTYAVLARSAATIAQAEGGHSFSTSWWRRSGHWLASRSARSCCSVLACGLALFRRLLPVRRPVPDEVTAAQAGETWSVSTEPDLEAALAAAGLADATPGETVPGSLVIAGPDDLPDAPEPVRWPDGAATGVGSLPGTDVTDAAAAVVGELPLLPHLPELPDRGVGADISAARPGFLSTSRSRSCVGWRVAARPGRHHRRALDLMRGDVDAFHQACESPSGPAG